MFFNHFFKYKTEMKYSLIAILLFSFTALQAQVKGTVKDNLGNPIAGANLFWQGTTQGTTTSADGTFSLSKPNDKHMLVVSFIGFENAPAFYGPATERIRRAREAVASDGKGE